MSRFHLLILFIFLSLNISEVSAQIHCGEVAIEPNTSVNQILTYDNFTKYTGGITINSVARIRVRIEDQTPIADPLCSWSLVMSIENNPGAGTPPTEWEELAQYGSGFANNPTINLLQVRIRNACTTSPIDGVYQSFTNHGDLIDIIAPLLPITPAGSCVNNVNGVGSYLTNYNEFNFDIDIRLTPGYTFNPGIFQANIHFTLTENP